MKPLTFVVLAATLCSPALGQKTILDGNGLDNLCRYSRMVDNGQHLPVDQYGNATFCIGYIRGILDDIWLEQDTADQHNARRDDSLKICISGEISNEQALKVAFKYLEDHPAKLQLPASYLVRQSMQEAFPCKTP